MILTSTVSFLAVVTAAAEPSVDVDESDPLLGIGCLDVTREPYRADSTGTVDSTSAIQSAVDDARDKGLVCDPELRRAFDHRSSMSSPMTSTAPATFTLADNGPRLENKTSIGFP